MFTAVNRTIIDRFRHLRRAVTPPTPSEPQHLGLANGSTIDRLGGVILNLKLTFLGPGIARAPIHTTTKCEVMDTGNHDFIIGVDLIPMLFPTDEQNNYLISPSRISTIHSLRWVNNDIRLYDPDDSDDDAEDECVHEQAAHMNFLNGLPVPLSPLTHSSLSPSLPSSSLLAADSVPALLVPDIPVAETPPPEPDPNTLHIDMGRLEASMLHDLQPHLRRGVLRISTVFAPNAPFRRQVFRATHRHRPAVSAVLVSNEYQLREDVLRLSDQINDMGVGNIPNQELPTRVRTSTAETLEKEYSVFRERILASLKPLLDKNAAFTGFCSDPEAVLDFTVDKIHEARLFTRQYPLADAWEKSINEILDRWRETGKIIDAPQGCKFNSPLLAVPKKDENGEMKGVRVCIDFRQLNKCLNENDRFQIPHIPDMISSLAHKKLYAQIDCSEAFGQWRLADSARPYTAFTWRNKQEMFAAAPFDIKTMPSLFQRFISRLFADMPFVICYIDNIAWGSDSWEEHRAHAHAILERLNSVNLRIKPDCVLIGQSEIILLGHVISEKGVGLDPEKQNMMVNWPTPLGGAGLSSFLGLGTFLRDHVRHYADLTAPLEKVKKQEVIDWDGNPKLLEHFNLVKRAFANAPFLCYPDFSKPFVVAADSSQLGLGGVLYQPSDADHTITKDNIVAVCSHQLNATQQRYPIYKKELWAIVYCLRKFHTYIYGKRDVNVYTDHKPLIHILNQSTMSQALQQYIDVIMDYDLIINYRPGLMHILPDALSRMFQVAYAEPATVWGTVPNVRFLDAYNSFSSPSDVLCAQSIADITPIKVLRKRHQPAHKQGKDTVMGKGKEEGNDISVSNLSSIHYCDTPSVSSLHCHTLEHSPSNFYEYEQNVVSVCAVVTDDELYEFDQAFLSAPLFYGSQHLVVRSATSISNVQKYGENKIYNDGPFTKAQEEEDKRMSRKRTTEERDSDCRIMSLRTTRSLKREEEEREAKRAEEKKKERECMTDEEKLLVAQSKRGKTLPSVDQRKVLVADAHLRGHFGEKAMLAFIDRAGYWWPGLRSDISDEIHSCVDCLRFSAYTFGFEPARSITASLPGDHYQIDLAQLPPSIDDYNYILILVDVFTGFVMLRTLKEKTAEATATALWDIFTTIGIPKILQSDNGKEFRNALLATLNRLVGIPHRFISAYNPRADGKVERTVKTVKESVVKLLQGGTALWPSYIPFVQLMYNTKVAELTGASPFCLMYGRKLNEMRDYTHEPSLPIGQNEWEAHQEKIVSIIYPALNKRINEKKSKQRVALDAMRKKLVKDELLEGSIVMILDPLYIANPSTRPVTMPKFIGPFTVLRRTLNGPYSLRDSTDALYARLVNIDQMKVLFRAPPKQDHNAEPAFQASYVVEKIVNDRMENDEQQYYVKWKNYPVEDSTWEPVENFDDITCIEKYWKEKMIEVKKKNVVPRISVLLYTHTS